jgi:hypothetical protein
MKLGSKSIYLIGLCMLLMLASCRSLRDWRNDRYLNKNGYTAPSKEGTQGAIDHDVREMDEKYGSHGGDFSNNGISAEDGGQGSAADIARMAEKSVGRVENSDYPPSGLKCAQQASILLIRAGVKVSGSHAVVGLVEQLKKIKWKFCKHSIAGAVAFTNSAYGNGPRSHIGVVGTDGYNVVNNLGRTEKKTKPWSSSMLYLIPPDASCN